MVPLEKVSNSKTPKGPFHKMVLHELTTLSKITWDVGPASNPCHPSGILVTFDGTNHFKLTDELYEADCNATKLIPQRAIMGANFLNFKAHEIYTKNGNLIDETFVKWDKDKNKCITGYTVSGNNIGIDETITVTGEALSFLSTGIDTRVYFIKNF